MAKLTDLVRPLVQQKAIVGLTGGGGTKLDGIATVGLPLSPVPLLVFAIGSTVYVYRLRAGTDAEASPDIIRPDDYAGGTNEKVWARSTFVTFPMLAPDLDAPIPYAFASNPDTGIWHDNSAPETLLLRVNGTDVVIILDNQMMVGGGSAAAPCYAFSDIGGDTAGFYFDPGTSKLGIAVGGLDVLKLTTLEVRLGGGVALAVDANANAIAGNAVLVAGTKHVSNVNVAVGAVIMLTRKTAGGTIGSLTYTIDGGGGGFTINSSDVADTSTISYLIVNVN